jgi:hypothetical protein
MVLLGFGNDRGLHVSLLVVRKGGGWRSVRIPDGRCEDVLALSSVLYARK